MVRRFYSASENRLLRLRATTIFKHREVPTTSTTPIPVTRKLRKIEASRYVLQLDYIFVAESAHRKTVRFHTSLRASAAITNRPMIIRHYCNGTTQLEQSVTQNRCKKYL